ncbi:MAG: VTT domain-containing protein [Acidobacteria bacterium]|nr:VTT domain-containing protein [Acidobacteriota bacterium]
MLDIWWLAAGYYALAACSAVLPWVNGELVMLSAIPLAGSPVELGALVAVVAAGQMTGKAAMYWVGRRTTRSRFRLEQVVDRWRERLSRCPASGLGVTFVSASVGIPPFYVVAMAAGALNVAFGRFVAVGMLGRLIHFGAVAFIPHLAWRGL